MELTEFLALVITGLVTGTITYFFTAQKLKTQFNHKLIENLYEKRFTTYTKLLEITQTLGKSETSFEDHKHEREELKRWIATSGGYLLLTSKTLREINTLKDLLKKGKSNTEGWEKEHLRKIFIARNNLRGALREEFNFFHSAETSI